MRSGWRLAATLALVSIGVLGAAETSAAKTVWLCKPGLKSNSCTPNQSTTTFSPSLQMLRDLVKREIDRKPSVRRKLISALLLGGGVTVRKGSDRGGDFRNVRACRSERQFGCVVAFSAFNGPVPADALFGRASGGLETLCTNPAALGGGSGPIEPLFPRAPFAPGSTIGALTVAIGAPRPSVDTPWLSFPDSYSARCSKADGASVLQVSPRGGAPVLTPVPAANWGLHIADVNIALGDLTELVRRQARNFLRRG